MSYFLIFLAVMLAAAIALYVVGLKRPESAGAVYDDGLAAPVSGLPPVLLPEHPLPEDVDSIRFSLGLRGYRMDQVDEVLDRLRDELAVQRLEITRLRGETAPPPAEPPLTAAPPPAGTGEPLGVGEPA